MPQQWTPARSDFDLQWHIEVLTYKSLHVTDLIVHSGCPAYLLLQQGLLLLG